MKIVLNAAYSLSRLWGTLQGSRQGIKDSIVSAIPQLVGVFTGIFSSALIARGLGPTGMGQYALVMSLAGVASILSDLGIGETAIRYASRAVASRDIPMQMTVLRWALRWRLSLVFLLTTAFFLLVPYIAKLWHSETLIPYMRLALLGGIFAALATIPTIYFQSIKRFTTNALVASVQKIISFAGILLLSIFSLWSLPNLILTNLFALAIGAFIFLIIVPKATLWPQDVMRKLKGLNLRLLIGSPKMKEDGGNGLDSSSPAAFWWFHMFATIISMLSMQMGIWLMAYFLGDKGQIGLYSVATRFTLPMTIVLGAVNTVLWPRASGLTERSQLSGLLKRSAILSVLLASVMTIYALTAPLLASFVFGSDFENSRLLGQVLCLRYCFAMLICPVAIVGYSLGLVRIMWIVKLMQLVVIVIFNVTLLQTIGPLASALALLASEVAGSCLLGMIILRRVHNLNHKEPIPGARL
ncbi:oligosaccharide flippase family protein [Candidatus Bipolaricaulota bacterium]